jgi:hypothetical protein
MKNIRRYWRKRMGYYWVNAEYDKRKEQKVRHRTLNRYCTRMWAFL